MEDTVLLTKLKNQFRKLRKKRELRGLYVDYSYVVGEVAVTSEEWERFD